MRSRNRSTLWKGGSFGSLLLILAALSFGQLSVEGGLYQTRTVRPGEKFRLKLVIQNPQKTPMGIVLTQVDISENFGNIATIPLGKTPRSNAGWIKLPMVKYVIPASTRAEIAIPVEVPLNAVGSYYSAICVGTAGLGRVQSKQFAAEVMMSMVVQFVMTAPGGKRLVRVVGTKINESGQLMLDVKNIGDDVLIFKITGDDLPPTMMRVYPGSTQRKLLDVSKLPDGTYHRRLILDNGSDWLVPVEIDFVKGRSQDDLALAYLHGERQQRIGDLSIGLDWGNLRKGIRLLGNLNLGRFSFSASGARNQFQDIFQNGYQVYGSFRTNHFSLAAGQFWYARNQTFRSVNGTIYFGRFSGSVNYSPDFKMTSIYSSINLSSRLSFSGYMTFGPGQKDWLGSVYYRIF